MASSTRRFTRAKVSRRIPLRLPRDTGPAEPEVVLTPSQRRVYDAIPDGGISPTSLAAAAGVCVTNVSKRLVVLEAKGLIQRVLYDVDKRRTLVVRTGDRPVFDEPRMTPGQEKVFGIVRGGVHRNGEIAMAAKLCIGAAGNRLAQMVGLGWLRRELQAGYSDRFYYYATDEGEAVFQRGAQC